MNVGFYYMANAMWVLRFGLCLWQYGLVTAMWAEIIAKQSKLITAIKFQVWPPWYLYAMAWSLRSMCTERTQTNRGGWLAKIQGSKVGFTHQPIGTVLLPQLATFRLSTACSSRNYYAVPNIMTQLSLRVASWGEHTPETIEKRLFGGQSHPSDNLILFLYWLLKSWMGNASHTQSFTWILSLECTELVRHIAHRSHSAHHSLLMHITYTVRCTSFIYHSHCAHYVCIAHIVHNI